MLALAASRSPGQEAPLLTDLDLDLDLDFVRATARVRALSEGSLGRAPDDEESTLAEQARGEVAFALGRKPSHAWSLAMLYGYSAAKGRARARTRGGR